MHWGTVLHASWLNVGDVVRPIPGPLVRVPGAPALFMPDDQHLPEERRRRVPATAGWRNAPVGGPEDFRQGYDTMTVTEVTAEFVTFVRPYYHVYGDGRVQTGVETVNMVSRLHGGHWYEVLQFSDETTNLAARLHEVGK